VEMDNRYSLAVCEPSRSTEETIGEISEGVDISTLLRLAEDGLLRWLIHHEIYSPILCSNSAPPCSSRL
ncbi:hypothetical protein, partial [Acidithiobacillus ferrivorans]|uniref:hypothetical protein n=2 Tax=Acidithiobacillus ferrivorans TaxID=160808 RepID=UPI001C06CDA3